MQAFNVVIVNFYNYCYLRFRFHSRVHLEITMSKITIWFFLGRLPERKEKRDKGYIGEEERAQWVILWVILLNIFLGCGRLRLFCWPY